MISLPLDPTELICTRTIVDTKLEKEEEEVKEGAVVNVVESF